VEATSVAAACGVKSRDDLLEGVAPTTLRRAAGCGTVAASPAPGPAGKPN